MYAEISEQPLDAARIVSLAGDDRSGAVVTFTGIVRNHDAGHAVIAIDYSAHPQADLILRKLVTQYGAREGVHGVAAVHRTGHVTVGEIAMVVSVSAEHRRQAFDAACDLVDSVNATLPVWKCQWLADSSHEWTGLSRKTL